MPRAASEWPGAGPWLPSRPTVGRLASAMAGCRGCSLHIDATQVVPGSGPDDASIMLVGEQPGDREDRVGEPFVGPAGQVLDRALEQVGIDPGSVFRTNAVKHFRFERRGSNRLHKSPARWQVAACQPWLLAELDAVRPPVVVLLGATAAQSVYGPSFRVQAQRGRELSWPAELEGPTPSVVVPTIHPAAVLRSRQREETYAGLVADLRVAEAAARSAPTSSA
ncbi:Phage SPO1 DNA polymerase-related protein [Nostocoides japonicum T1-X7]|uniref:Type-4 uracil-DNA glycosylase n=1 Tax=Nostocoides japonicum T1-X7 TaxID=1194083 RepID=A0A077LZG5_9MICO|nr:UdgX family uracil-DNA binding protein [Tetrasphaera japonica]CCH79338.1 Phage SPO1 DNA polymerase-related protein [Tetrasphaera japonica T1-X7]